MEQSSPASPSSHDSLWTTTGGRSYVGSAHCRTGTWRSLPTLPVTGLLATLVRWAFPEHTVDVGGLVRAPVPFARDPHVQLAWSFRSARLRHAALVGGGRPAHSPVRVIRRKPASDALAHRRAGAGHRRGAVQRAIPFRLVMCTAWRLARHGSTGLRLPGESGWSGR